MMKKSVKKTYCFSKRLKARLEKISDYNLTVVEAPSGFGKTTAVREYFAAARLKNVHCRWYTCLGESPAKAWSGICKLFHDVGNDTAEALLELGVPTRELLQDVAALLRAFQSREETYIIIDNYQMFLTDVPVKLIESFAACGCKNTHIIIITQPLIRDDETTCAEWLHHNITPKDLFFNNACVSAYCRIFGIQISKEDIDRMQTASDGWVAAIRLQLTYYMETGLLMDARAIGSLVETAVWNKLTDDERRCMAAVALLDGFTPKQAVIMGGESAMPKSMARLLAMDFFIRYVADKKVYSMHSILRDYLLERFSLQPQAVVDVMHRRAAAACLSVGDYFQAAIFFMKVADYDAILALPLTAQYFYNNKEVNCVGFFESLVDNCPPQKLKKYPIVLILIAYMFFRYASRAHFIKTVAMLNDLLDLPEALPDADLARAQAEFSMLSSFQQYNDIIKMSAYHRKAYDYLKTISDNPRSVVFTGTMPWGVGIPSIMGIYWNRSGDLAEELKAMDDCLPIYSELANGHGAGAEHVFRAEAALARGDDAEAEVMCYKAVYRAHAAHQFGVVLCAEIALAEIAVLRGDAGAYAAQRESIAKTSKESHQRSVARMGELCLAVLDLGLGKIDNLPSWLCSVEGIKKILYAHAIPYGVMVYCHLLTHGKRYAELYGLTEYAMGLTHNSNLAQNMNYVLPQVYLGIYLAVANAQENRNDLAMQHLRGALALALPDGVYLPFAKFSSVLLPLLEGGGAAPGGEDLSDLVAYCNRYAQGMRAILRAASKGSSLLTPREREVAKLAKERLSAHEIAVTLGITVNTANTILKNIYRKLEINSKLALRDKDF